MLYGFKTEASVLPNCICISTSHVPAGTLDITVFRQNSTWHQVAAEKGGDENEGEDLGELESEFPNS